MVKKIKMLFLSCLTIMLCISAIAVGTYALFSQEVTLTNHLQAANLGFKLERTYIEKTIGGVVQTPVDETANPTDFTNATTENIFGLTQNDYVVPTDSLTVTLKLTNTGNIAFKYWVKLDNFVGEQSFRDQLSIELLKEDGTAYDGGTETNPIIVQAGATALTFKVKVTFEDLITNNSVMNKSVSFDLVVSAVQLVDGK
ncbi:MAG: hypothetical protein IJA88_06615 [Clostridia bacterium]|nr:hypothetical protein [Clostridia bacterium]